MKTNEKLRGIFPAFYACYDDDGEISPARVRALATHLRRAGVDGLYVGGSSGECIYQTVPERKLVLENVMEAVGGDLPVIAHIACNGVSESQMLAAHAQKLGVCAIAAIPPIYFHLPEAAIADYWNRISDAAPGMPLILYNIPQLAGVSLTPSLLERMLKNANVAGVKNSSMATMDIQLWKTIGGEDFTVFNGPDEQLASGLAAGANGGIGGTYGAMPRLYLKLYERFTAGDIDGARAIQGALLGIINQMCRATGNLYSVLKALLRIQGVEIGEVRCPLPRVAAEDQPLVDACARRIETEIQRYY